jgi:hypothetical protein
MLSISMPASVAQGPLYSVMRRQQMEVQQKRKRLDAESEPPAGAGAGGNTFRIGASSQPRSTPHGILRPLPSFPFLPIY